MAISFNEYPYTNFHELNADWIISIIKSLETEIKNFVNLNTIKYADPIDWNITNQYEANTVVIDPATGNAYISVQAVPNGVDIGNTTYWTPIFNYQNITDKIEKSIASLEDTGYASTSYAIGQLLWMNDNFYIVTIPISTGSQIIVDTNVKAITVESWVNTLINALRDELLDEMEEREKLAETVSENTKNLTLLQNDLGAEINNREDADNTIIKKLSSAFISVKDYGAIGDGSTDDTEAIQNAINKAISDGGNVVYFPTGTYLVSHTLYVNSTAGISLVGNGQTRTVIYRKTDYGDTLVLGSENSPAIESTTISNLWFYHDFGGYENGKDPSTLINKPTTGAHIKAYNAIRFKLNKCTLWNMPYNIIFYGGSDNDIVENNFRGVWDYQETRLQVTIASVLLEIGTTASSNAAPTDFRFRDNKFTGYLSPTRNVTYGTATYSGAENIGPLWGIRINACEVVQIDGGSFGSHSDCGVYVRPTSPYICSSVYIRGIFFDGNRLSGIRINNENDNQILYNLTISNNQFIGQNNSDNAIYIGQTATDNLASVVGAIINNNLIMNYQKTPIVLLRVEGIEINSNNIRDWNTMAGFIGDAFNGDAIYIGDGVNHLRASNNSLGGGYAYEDYTGTDISACYYGIYISTAAKDCNLIGNVIPKKLVNIPILNASTAENNIITENSGFNENRTPISPTIPTSGVSYINTTGSSAWIKISGGVINDVTLNGISVYTGTSFGFEISPNDVIVITYTDTPTWSWFLH